MISTICWEHPYGAYARPQVKRVAVYAHRAAWEALVGPIPPGFEIDHLCRNKACYNPSHLEPVTPAENRRRQALAKKTCVNGHPRSGLGRCLPCHADAERERYRREQ